MQANKQAEMGAKAQTISDYELIDHGIDNSQYFQGCGTCFTSFDNVVTGCGDNFAEALEDALDSIAQQTDGDVTEGLEARIRADGRLRRKRLAYRTQRQLRIGR